jgi:hypothetical protein
MAFAMMLRRRLDERKLFACRDDLAVGWELSCHRKGVPAMSRHAFGEILGNEAELFACVGSLDDAGNADGPRDLKGYGVDEWLDCAVVGWDEPMQTYFLLRTVSALHFGAQCHRGTADRVPRNQVPAGLWRTGLLPAARAPCSGSRKVRRGEWTWRVACDPGAGGWR